MKDALLRAWRGEVTRQDVLVEVRIGARALHRFYRMALVLTLVFLPWELSLTGERSLDGPRLLVRIVWYLGAFAAMELTRRTHVRTGGIIMTLFMLALIGSEMIHYGGINVLAMTMFIPMLMCAFVQARREVIVSAIVFTVLVTIGHVWLSWFVETPFAREPIYEPVSALVTFVIMQIGSAMIMYLGAHHTSRNVERLEQSRREFEIARRYEKVRREEAEESRTQADLAMRAKSRFLANMSHELRTPLNAIIGYAEIIDEELEDHPSLAADCSQDVQRVKRAGRHLLEVINDILDLSRLEVEKMPIQPRQVALDEVLELARDYLSRRQDDETLEHLSFPDHSEGVLVFGDPERLAQLLALGILAIQASGHIELEHQATRVTLRFVPGESLQGDDTKTLIELRSVLRDTLMAKLEVEGGARDDDSWQMCIPLERRDMAQGDARGAEGDES